MRLEGPVSETLSDLDVSWKGPGVGSDPQPLDCWSDPWQSLDWESERVPAVLSPTYKQRNEDFRKLFKSLPDTERLIVDYSCALQRDILLQGRLYLSENWICFYSNIFRWETLLMVRLKDICTMTKEKTARLIPNAIQLCTDNEKHFFTSFGARDRTYMMMFRLWQNALLEKPLCPKELWHFVHQCYGSELGLTSDDEDYVPPDDDFNTMGCCPSPWCRYCEELPAEDSSEHHPDACNTPAKTPPDVGPGTLLLPQEAYIGVDHDRPGLEALLPDELPLGLVEEDPPTPLREGEVPPPPLLAEEQADQQDVGHSPAPSLDLDEHEELPTELSDSSETHDEGEVQAFQEDLRGRQYINEVYKFSVDKMFSVLFTESPFMRGFLEQRRFSDVVYRPWTTELEADQTRELTYNVSLSNPLTPKTAAVSETQTLYKASQERECYIVDAEVVTHHVPYHDYFYTLNRYVLTRVAKHKCRLRVSTEIRYRKQPWGLVKGFIERSSWSGLDEYFRHFELALAKAEEALSEPLRRSLRSMPVRTGAVRRRKRPPLAVLLLAPGLAHEALRTGAQPEDEDEEEDEEEEEEEEDGLAEQGIRRIKHVAGSTQTRHVPDRVPGGGAGGGGGGGLALHGVSKMLLLISYVLVLLVFLNMMLFYKLWGLEYTAQSLTSWRDLQPQESKPPQTNLEWTQLLESQQRYHDDELQKWKEILESSVLLLYEMKSSLLHLQNDDGGATESQRAEEQGGAPGPSVPQV
ncbi:unnamed protein product [Arctogadus glacialis]